MSEEIKVGDHLYLVDGSSYIWRAFYALPKLTRKSDGAPVGAIAGFCNMIFELIKETKRKDKPTHFAVIFDAPGKTFRNDIYPDYKGHRPPKPEDLTSQMPMIRYATRAFNLPAVEMDGFEADDLIATYAEQASEAGAMVTIVSPDKDFMQLIRDDRESERGIVEMLDPLKHKKLGIDETVEKFGVRPEQVIDVQALAGDAADNVPGVVGIGVKTAAKLINEFGSLDALLSRVDEIPQPKRRQSLIQYADQARLSRDLVTLRRDVEVHTSLSDFAVTEIDPGDLIAFLRAMEFRALARQTMEYFENDSIFQ